MNGPQGRLVSKSWNGFLSNDKKIWQDVLKKQLPNIIHYTNKLAENEEENSTFWNEVWSRIEKDDNIGPKELIESFNRVQHIFEVVKICAESEFVDFKNFNTVDYLPFHDDFVGEKVKKEIRREIMKNENLPVLLTVPTIATELQFFAILLGDWSSTLQNPHRHYFLNQAILLSIFDTKEEILVEINEYLLNE